MKGETSHSFSILWWATIPLHSSKVGKRRMFYVPIEKHSFHHFAALHYIFVVKRFEWDHNYLFSNTINLELVWLTSIQIYLVQ